VKTTNSSPSSQVERRINLDLKDLIFLNKTKMTRSHRIVSMDIKYQMDVVSKSDKKSLHLLIIHMCSIEDQRRRST
jgi:hypothetical protein